MKSQVCIRLWEQVSQVVYKLLQIHRINWPPRVAIWIRYKDLQAIWMLCNLISHSIWKSWNLSSHRCATKDQSTLRSNLIHWFSLYRAFKGHPSVLLPIIHFTILMYSKPVAQYINDKGFELFAQNDYSFVTSVFEILSMLFKYKPFFSID